MREQAKSAHEEALKNKEKELEQMTEQFNQLKNDLKKNSDVDAATAEELRTLQIAYEKMITAKDKEIKEVEERLEEMVGSDNSRIKNEVRYISNFFDFLL